MSESNQPQNQTEAAILAFFKFIDPKSNAASAEQLEQIRNAIEDAEKWEAQEEWRISTWTDTRIERIELDGVTWYHVNVACDMQEFSCNCPSIERAFFFASFYRDLIERQFYSVGAPWM